MAGTPFGTPSSAGPTGRWCRRPSRPCGATSPRTVSRWAVTGPGVLVTDWTAEEGADPRWHADRAAAERSYKLSVHDPRARTATYDRLAGLQLARGCRLLAAGRAVVTDRLHGHLLSLLLGLPHVALPDWHGKLTDLRDTWIAHWPTARLAHTPAEALARARQMAGARTA
ncbi:polysaccharide pyruvyl transferase family protein [Actinacidiphila oryziradicis]|uniref:polysaccharide pyruvyl transferase family protein n=1 Tax=Actinacidiphila oryziradicis TaxID=2571141 RepID=UPI00145CBE37|nr:polysaccharide pyruvyl transferase family protein [Actinacidiphila oryziradicis]